MSVLKVLGDKNPQMTLGSTGAKGDWPDQGTIEVRSVFGSVSQHSSAHRKMIRT